MKLFFWRANRDNGNFGDQLNPYLWDKLIPGVLDNDFNELFIGIGSILNDRIPKVPKINVFGTGVRYGDLPILHEGWKFTAFEAWCRLNY